MSHTSRATIKDFDIKFPKIFIQSLKRVAKCDKCRDKLKRKMSRTFGKILKETENSITFDYKSSMWKNATITVTKEGTIDVKCDTSNRDEVMEALGIANDLYIGKMWEKSFTEMGMVTESLEFDKIEDMQEDFALVSLKDKSGGVELRMKDSSSIW
tara:strand:+ start:1032 stop:1499 length:468 start_codon:yes stop_codon:yes gene_type:complete